MLIFEDRQFYSLCWIVGITILVSCIVAVLVVPGMFVAEGLDRYVYIAVFCIYIRLMFNVFPAIRTPYRITIDPKEQKIIFHRIGSPRKSSPLSGILALRWERIRILKVPALKVVTGAQTWTVRTVPNESFETWSKIVVDEVRKRGGSVQVDHTPSVGAKETASRGFRLILVDYPDCEDR